VVGDLVDADVLGLLLVGEPGGGGGELSRFDRGLLAGGSF